MRKLYFLFTFSIISGITYAQESAFELIWSKVYGTEKIEILSVGMKTSDNHILMGGQRFDEHNTLDNTAILIKTDLNGNEIWTKEYSSEDHIYISDLLELPDGDYVIVLTNENNPSFNPFYSIRRISAGGQTIWSTPLQLIEEYYPRPFRMMLTADNHIVVHGYLKLAKFELESGNLVWMKELQSPYYSEWAKNPNILGWQDKVVHIAVSAVFVIDGDGNVTDMKPFPHKNFKDDLDLTQDWQFIDFSRVEGTILTRDGGILAYGIGEKSFWNSQTQQIEDEDQYFGVVKKFDANLDLEYSKTYTTGVSPITGFQGHNFLRDAVELSNGNIVLVAGGRQWLGTRSDEDVWLFEINTQGDMLWSAFFGGTDEEVGSYYEYGSKIIFLSDDEFIITTASKSDDGNVPENHGNYDFWAFRVEIDRSLLGTESITKQDIAFYPNPTEDFVYFQNDLKNISIYNSLGQEVKTIERPERKINFSEFSSGIYLIHAKNEEGHREVFKVIKK